MFEIANTEIRTLSRVKTEIAMLLAGAAAERLVLGDHSAGVGGKIGSDLHRATALATAAYRSWGLGERLTFLEEQSGSTSGLWHDPIAHSWAADLIASCMERAIGILRGKRSALETMAEELLKLENTPGERILATLATVDPITASRPSGDQGDP